MYGDNRLSCCYMAYANFTFITSEPSTRRAETQETSTGKKNVPKRKLFLYKYIQCVHIHKSDLKACKKDKISFFKVSINLNVKFINQ